VNSDENHVAAQIAKTVTGGLDDDWHLIAVELRSFRDQHSPATGASLYKEFILATELISYAALERTRKFLQECRARYVRPDEVIEPTFNALRELIQPFRSYVQKRAAEADCFGVGDFVSALGNQAIENAERALTQTYILALQGFTGSTTIFDPVDWPTKEDTGLQGATGIQDVRDAEPNATRESDEFDQFRPTAASERRATDYLAQWLMLNQQLTKREARDLLQRAKISVSATGFNHRVWPNARERAGLSRKAPPGQKPQPVKATNEN
jgi:hypothetical protein